MRSFARALSLAAVLLGCGGDPVAPAAPPEAIVDRSAAERPDGMVVELSLDGGDGALSALAAQLPASAMRSALPTRIGTLLDGLIETPAEIRSRVASDSPLRLVMARIDGELRSAVAVRLESAIEPATHRGDGPRGSERVGDRAAVDDRIAVVADDPAMLERAFAYLAYGALGHGEIEGQVVAHVPAGVLATTVRTALEQRVRDARASAMGSILAARAAHDRPPDLGDPEALVTLVAEAALTRLAYLPDLGDATLTLAPTPSGLALTLAADVTEDSPLARALEERAPIGAALVAAMPTSSALVIASGTTAAARAATRTELAETLAAIGGARVTASERAGLDEVSSTIASIRGDEGALALGSTPDGGPFALTFTRTGSSTPAPMPWGRAFPWSSQIFAGLAGCNVVTSRPSVATPTVCGEVGLATRAAGGVRVDVIGRDAAALAETTRAALAQGTSASSPDLSRDLSALPSAPFAIVLARPLAALALVRALGAPSEGLPRGDGAALLALAYEGPRLTMQLRASASAMADLDVVARLFADETDSE